MKDQLKKIKLKFYFKLKFRISFYERLAAFTKAGISIVDSLKSIRARLEKKKSPRVELFDLWLSEMAKGSSLSMALKDWIPPSEFMLINSGEQGGKLLEGLNEAVRLSKADSLIKKTIIKNSIMPVLLVAMIGGMLAMFDMLMAPAFKNILPVSQWGDAAQLLNSISSLIHNYWYFAVIFVIMLAVLIGQTIKSWVGSVRDVFDKIPPWSIYKNYQASSFLIGLASMLKAGVALNDALRKMAKNASPWMLVHLEQMMVRLKVGGTTPGEALDTGLFDEDIAGDIADYSRLASFETAIHMIGEKMINEGIESTTEKMAVFKNLLLFLVAGTVIWIYITTYTLQTEISDRLEQNRGS